MTFASGNHGSSALGCWSCACAEVAPFQLAAGLTVAATTKTAASSGSDAEDLLAPARTVAPEADDEPAAGVELTPRQNGLPAEGTPTRFPALHTAV